MCFRKSGPFQIPSRMCTHPLTTLLDHLLRLSSDKGVEWLMLARHGPIPPAQLPLFHTTLPADYDLRSGLLLKCLEGVAAWADEQADEVDLRVVILRDPHLL